ncbi:hypothetical protein DH2020_040926 [Rehmannia glutinosa]|uniref:Uncharacterized protein n=1 Tax=Rehmannia glutinosa TaxID=99300 RepID=A0ABR0UTM6_REHGL
MRQHKESVLNVLHSRETQTSSTKLASSTRKSQCFYTRSLCAAKFESSEQPLVYPITNASQTTKDADKRLRPRQFEYHPSDSSLMAVGTLDGEVVVLNHETGNIVSCISPYGNMNSILGLCWLKQQPSNQNWKMATATLTVIFDDFEQLTSVHVNSSDDRCLTSGYSKKVAIYDICSGQRLQLFTDMHREPINVAKFSNHSPNLFVTSSFDRDIKMWDSRQKPMSPCYSASSSRGNVMVLFSPDDLYLLVSAVDNEVKQLLSVDGRLHTDFGIVSTGSAHNYTRSYYMNGRDYIISGSCEEPIIRVCCAQTGRRLRDISLEHFDMAVLAAYARPTSKYEIIKVNLLSSSHSDEENQGGLNICNSYCKGG